MSIDTNWDVDSENDRIIAYFPSEISLSNIAEFEMIKKKKSTGKLIVYSPINVEKKLGKVGFEQEAMMDGFFNGSASMIYTLYITSERKKSHTVKANRDVLKIVSNDQKKSFHLCKGVTFLIPTFDLLDELSELYKKVFSVYPTNIFEPSYIKQAMASNYLFMVAIDGDQKLIGAASAMKTGYGSAEITDCAVDPEYRGKNILHGLITKLEEKLMKQGIMNVFSLTRSISVGMNMTVSRLGYRFQGTLINNCKISTGFEDMNIWTKKLSIEGSIRS